MGACGSTSSDPAVTTDNGDIGSDPEKSSNEADHDEIYHKSGGMIGTPSVDPRGKDHKIESATSSSVKASVGRPVEPVEPVDLASSKKNHAKKPKLVAGGLQNIRKPIVPKGTLVVKNYNTKAAVSESVVSGSNFISSIPEKSTGDEIDSAIETSPAVVPGEEPSAAVAAVPESTSSPESTSTAPVASEVDPKIN